MTNDQASSSGRHEGGQADLSARVTDTGIEGSEEARELAHIAPADGWTTVTAAIEDVCNRAKDGLGPVLDLVDVHVAIGDGPPLLPGTSRRLLAVADQAEAALNELPPLFDRLRQLAPEIEAYDADEATARLLKEGRRVDGLNGEGADDAGPQPPRNGAEDGRRQVSRNGHASPPPWPTAAVAHRRLEALRDRAGQPAPGVSV